MNRIAVGLIVGLVLVGGLYFFIAKPLTGTQPRAAGNAPAATITIQSMAFKPISLTVKPGTTVTWINKDQVAHRIDGGTYSSGDLSLDDSYKFTFNNPGTYNYICSIHPFMKGQIVVQ
jgi:plastocyanin